MKGRYGYMLFTKREDVYEWRATSLMNYQSHEEAEREALEHIAKIAFNQILPAPNEFRVFAYDDATDEMELEKQLLRELNEVQP